MQFPDGWGVAGGEGWNKGGMQGAGEASNPSIIRINEGPNMVCEAAREHVSR